MNNLDGALKMHEKALQLSHRINDRHGIRQYLNNKGLIFEERAQFENAMNIYAECLSISKQMNEKRSICVSYCNIGYILEYQGAFTQSLKYFKRAYDLATKIGYQGFGALWPVRFMGFATSMMTFPLLTWLYLGETITLKTAVTIMLSVVIMIIQMI